MISTSNNTRLFGMDLSQWPRQWRAAGALLFQMPGLRRLTPPARVQLLRANGERSDWVVSHGHARVAPPGSGAAIQAVELARDSVLERQLTLPRLSPGDLDHAVQLDVQAATPFDPAQTVYGYSARPAGNDALRVEVAIAARQHVERRVQAAVAGAPSTAVTAAPEVWVLPPGPLATGFEPLVIQGFGTGQRERITARGRTLNLALLLLAVLLLLAMAFTPTAQLRLRAIQAQRASDALHQQVGPQTALREAINKESDRLKAINQLTAQQLALIPVLNMLTRAVPDGAWLNSFRAEGNKVVVNGNADDAAALVQRLGTQPGVRDVRLLSPATRVGVGAKENFNIEMNLDPHVYGIVRTRGTS